MGVLDVQLSEKYRLTALLTVVGGFLEAYTFLTRAGVFANAQTGNIARIGLAAAGGRFPFGPGLPSAAYLLCRRRKPCHANPILLSAPFFCIDPLAANCRFAGNRAVVRRRFYPCGSAGSVFYCDNFLCVRAPG